ncbi:MAG: ABC transporter permease [Christensenella sp.]|nr:ABC transporter permease [Christensenella sp.]
MTMFLNSLRLAVRSTLANKMRSFLTMLGIFMGGMGVGVLVSVVQSATNSVSSAIASMGSDLITVSVTDEDVVLDAEDYMPLEQYSAISGVAPYLTVSSTARSGSNYTSVSAIGVTGEYMDVAGRDLESGRSIVDSDLDWRTYTAVIGTEVAGELYENYDVIGKTFTMSGHTFTIVGLLTESGSSTDSQILIPLTTAQRISDSTSISNCYVQASSTSNVSLAQSLTEQQMLSLTGDEDSYDVYNMSEILDTMDDVMSTLSLMLGGIAAISLLVGGIGIMNIMLVSVAERTRENGIRKALGARRSHIMMQFLIEACVLSILGGLIGLGLSALGLQIYGLIADTTIRMEWVAAMGSLLFCVIIGVAFGSYPAAKASKMTPIDALQRN